MARNAEMIGREERKNPHRLLFVVLDYADFVEIDARFGQQRRDVVLQGELTAGGVQELVHSSHE